jgi:hypothetical protein
MGPFRYLLGGERDPLEDASRFPDKRSDQKVFLMALNDAPSSYFSLEAPQVSWKLFLQ